LITDARAPNAPNKTQGQQAGARQREEQSSEAGGGADDARHVEQRGCRKQARDRQLHTRARPPPTVANFVRGHRHRRGV
jgi:hypothetical protein